jgi:hypothetical protein
MWLSTIFFVALTWSLLCATPAWGHGCGHHGRCDHGCRWCDTGSSRWRRPLPPPARFAEPGANLETQEGKVSDVLYLPGATTSSGMVEIRLEVGDQPMLVRLAPAGFLKQRQLMIKEGDTLAVTGYWVASAEGDLLVATEVSQGEKTLRLRNESGRPAW